MTNLWKRLRPTSATASHYGVTLCVVVLSSFVAIVACKKRDTSSLESFDSNVYSFGGACGSRGFWTQTAISRAKEIVSTVTKLKDNPKCNKLFESMKNLGDIQSSYTPAPENGQRFSRMMTLNREIASINNYLNMTDFKRGDVLALLLDRTIEQKTLEVQNMAESQSTSGLSSDGNALNIVRNSVSSVENRMNTAAQVGLDRLQKYYQALNESAECVNDNPSLGGVSLLAQSAQVLGAFASGDPVTASNVSNAINSFTKMMRDNKYNRSLRNENDAVLADSIGCMMESVQYSFCAARDAQSILSNGGDRLQKRLNPSGSSLDKNSPFYAYYIMSYYLPVVTRWLNTVTSGYIPRTKSDVKLINRVIEVPVDVEKYSMSLRSIYAQYMRDFSQQTESNAKAGLLYKMIKELNQEINYMVFPMRRRMLDPRRDPPPKQNVAKGDIPNFFKMKNQGIYLTFRLLGLEGSNVPKECIPNTDVAKTAPLTFDKWATGGDTGYNRYFYRYDLPTTNTSKNEFPGSLISEKTLPDVIKIQLEGLIDEAHAAASDYFWMNLPLDMEVVAADAGAGMIGNAMSSLSAIQGFVLAQLDILQKDSSADAVIGRGSLLDTYKRIDAVLAAYREFSNNSSPDAAKKFIATTYERFNMVFQGSAFLPQRLLRVVKRDLVKNVQKQQFGATSLEPEILYAAGDLAFDQILSGLGGDVQAGQTQLAAAQTLNKASLAAIDDVFGDKLISIISRYRNAAMGQGDLSDRSTFTDSYLRSKMDSRRLPRVSSDTFLDRMFNASLDSLEGVGIKAFIKRSWYPDLYPMPSPWRGPGYHDDEFGSLQIDWAVLCNLTLAFPKPERYASVCNGAIQYSPFEGGGKLNGHKRVGPLSLAYNNWNKSLNSDGGIPHTYPSSMCAYYDVARRNQIYNITLDHLIVGDSSAIVPFPSESGQADREFLADESFFSADSKSYLSLLKKKIGKVPANTTYCNPNGGRLASVCDEYDRRLTARNAPNHGSVAVACYDLKGQKFYCCNGSLASGLLPAAGNAPCYSSLEDEKSLVQTLKESDLPSH